MYYRSTQSTDIHAQSSQWASERYFLGGEFDQSGRGGRLNRIWKKTHLKVLYKKQSKIKLNNVCYSFMFEVVRDTTTQVYTKDVCMDV